MKLSITITCTNGAFFDDDGAEAAIGPECSRILRNLAHMLADEDDPGDGWTQLLTDVNGNTVGTAKFSIR